MPRACVIGYPVSHSLSPRLHNYWLKKYGINGEYTAIEVSAECLTQFISSLPQRGYAGCSITIPHKEAALALANEIDQLAKVIGAANMITVSKNGKTLAANSDAYGFIENIKSQAEFKTNKAVVLGAGGAARAAVKALADEGFESIIIANRTREKAQALRGISKKISVCAWEEKEDALKGADLLINTTSLGLKGKTPLKIDLKNLPRSAIVNDIVYNPLITDFLAAAKENGNKTIDGLGMLIWQAVPAFESWFGVRPEVDNAVRQHLLEAL